MRESVRFFWRGGEAALPVDAIPEADRHPLQVRLGVVREHIPAVVQQLEQGRYVAAGWQSSREVFLILCHPSLSRGSADALALNTREMPRVILRTRGWDEVPKAAQLLLTAFGGEVTDEKECVTARLALRDWLMERKQDAMAAVVMRYLTF